MHHQILHGPFVCLRFIGTFSDVVIGCDSFSPHVTVLLEFTLGTNQGSLQGYLSLAYTAFNLLGNFHWSAWAQVKKKKQYGISKIPFTFKITHHKAPKHPLYCGRMASHVCSSWAMKCPREIWRKVRCWVKWTEKTRDSACLSLKPVLTQLAIKVSFNI